MAFQEPFFPKREFTKRWSRAYEKTEELGVDALLAYNPGNQFWLTGYEGSLSGDKFAEFSHDVIFPEVLLPQGEEPILLGLVIAEETYRNETHVDEVRTFLPGERVSLIGEVLRDEGLSSGRIGIDLGAYESITVPEYEALEAEVPGVEWIDATETFERLRMIKTEQEIAALRHAVEIQNLAFQKFVKRIDRNMSERDLIFKLHECQWEAGATEVGIAMPWTHPGYTFFRQQYPDRLMEPGNIQWIDGGAIYHGYNSDYDLIINYGEPDETALQTYEKLKNIYEAGIKHFEPGRQIREIAEDVFDTVETHDAVDPLDGRFIGHNLGYDMVEKPWLGIDSPKDLTLEENMVLAPEWFVETPYGPILYEENFVVREDGLERLTRFPRKLQVVD